MDRVIVDKVSKSYGRSYAVNRVSTRFEAGQLIALLGPNGAGKSTLLTMLATLTRPDRGELHYDAMSQMELVRKARDRVGYVSHDALLYIDLTGRENLSFFASMYAVSEPEARIADLLERVDMTGAGDKLVRAYSRGMRQRLSIARSLLQRPDVLVLDEPFTGLDQWGALDLVGLLEEERSAGRIIVLSTHRVEVLNGVANGVRVLDRGRLITDRALEPGESIEEAYTESFRSRRGRAR